MSLNKKSIFERGGLYLLAVSVGFITDISVFWGLSQAGLGLLVANACAFLVGFTINVLLIRAFAFRGTAVPGHWDFALTFVVNVAVMLLGTALIWTFSTLFDLNLLIAKILANGFTLLVNFSFRNLLDRYWKCFPTSQKQR